MPRSCCLRPYLIYESLPLPKSLRPISNGRRHMSRSLSTGVDSRPASIPPQLTGSLNTDSEPGPRNLSAGITAGPRTTRSSRPRGENYSVGAVVRRRDSVKPPTIDGRRAESRSVKSKTILVATAESDDSLLPDLPAIKYIQNERTFLGTSSHDDAAAAADEASHSKKATKGAKLSAASSSALHKLLCHIKCGAWSENVEVDATIVLYFENCGNLQADRRLRPDRTFTFGGWSDCFFKREGRFTILYRNLEPQRNQIMPDLNIEAADQNSLEDELTRMTWTNLRNIVDPRHDSVSNLGLKITFKHSGMLTLPPIKQYGVPIPSTENTNNKAEARHILVHIDHVNELVEHSALSVVHQDVMLNPVIAASSKTKNDIPSMKTTFGRERFTGPPDGTTTLSISPNNSILQAESNLVPPRIETHDKPQEQEMELCSWLDLVHITVSGGKEANTVVAESLVTPKPQTIDRSSKVEIFPQLTSNSQNSETPRSSVDVRIKGQNGGEKRDKYESALIRETIKDLPIPLKMDRPWASLVFLHPKYIEDNIFKNWTKADFGVDINWTPELHSARQRDLEMLGDLALRVWTRTHILRMFPKFDGSLQEQFLSLYTRTEFQHHLAIHVFKLGDRYVAPNNLMVNIDAYDVNIKSTEWWLSTYANVFEMYIGALILQELSSEGTKGSHDSWPNSKRDPHNFVRNLITENPSAALMNPKIEKIYIDAITPFMECGRIRTEAFFKHHSRDSSWKIWERTVLPAHEPGSHFDVARVKTNTLTRVVRRMTNTYGLLSSKNEKLASELEKQNLQMMKLKSELDKLKQIQVTATKTKTTKKKSNENENPQHEKTEKIKKNTNKEQYKNTRVIEKKTEKEQHKKARPPLVKSVATDRSSVEVPTKLLPIALSSVSQTAVDKLKLSSYVTPAYKKVSGVVKEAKEGLAPSFPPLETPREISARIDLTWKLKQQKKYSTLADFPKTNTFKWSEAELSTSDFSTILPPPSDVLRDFVGGGLDRSHTEDCVRIYKSITDSLRGTVVGPADRNPSSTDQFVRDEETNTFIRIDHQNKQPLNRLVREKLLGELRHKSAVPVPTLDMNKKVQEQ